MQQENHRNTDTSEYVEVADEPLHKEIHADGHFRAYMATIAPGQATGFHRHSQDTLYIVIHGGRMYNKNYRGSKRSSMFFPRSFPLYKKLWFAVQNVFTGAVRLPDGLFFFMPTQKNPSIHLAKASPRNRNAACLMGVEVRYGSTGFVPHAHNTPALRVEFDNGVAKVLVCRLGPGASCDIALPGYHLFAVCTKGFIQITPEPGAGAKRDASRLAVGDYLPMSGDILAMAANPGDTASEGIILAIPGDKH